MNSLLISPPHVCPACGYSGLKAPPYTALMHGPVPDALSPPYCQYFGEPSYEVCDCCGFEFGNDDDPGTSLPVSFGAYRAAWISDGAKWFNASKMPMEWTLERQLQAAAITSR